MGRGSRCCHTPLPSHPAGAATLFTYSKDMIIVLTLSVILLAIFYARSVKSQRRSQRDIATIQVRLDNLQHAEIRTRKQHGDWLNLLTDDVEKAHKAGEKLNASLDEIQSWANRRFDHANMRLGNLEHPSHTETPQ
jgi:hypothetical protein